MLNYLFDYEILGYLALSFNLYSFLQKEAKATLLLLFVSSLLFILNMIILNLPEDSILIVTVGLFVTLVSIVFMDSSVVRRKLIKLSPLLSLYVIYIYDFTMIGVLSGIGFLFATVAKLQSEIIPMKLYLLFSTVVWLGIMLHIGYLSFIIFYAAGTLVISFSIYREQKRIKLLNITDQ